MSLPTTIDVTRNPIDAEPTLHVMNGTGVYIQVPVTRAEFWKLVERFAAMFPDTTPTLSVADAMSAIQRMTAVNNHINPEAIALAVMDDAP